MNFPVLRCSPVVFCSQKRQAGYTLFECAVAAIVFAILAGVLLTRMAFYQDEAEQAAVRKMIGDLQSALNLQVASLRAQNRAEEITALAGQNPIDWVAENPANYGGQFYSPGAQDVAPGSWYFDRRTRNLVYVFQDGKTFRSNAMKRNYFKVESLRLPTNTAKPSRTPADNQSVVLIQVDG